MHLPNIIKRTIGDEGLGWMDYYLRPALRKSWGGAFNGQEYRQAIFHDIMNAVRFRAIIETGTFHGTTTELFVTTGLPIYTVEAQQRYYSYSKHRFKRRDLVHLYLGDSRTFLEQMAHSPGVPDEDVFFYLDAHWEMDLPLREEAEIIFANWRKPVIMVDDFCVPNSQYGYDGYGAGNELTLAYLEPVLRAHAVTAFFPAVDADTETGLRRGSVVLAREAEAVDTLRGIQRLREWHGEEIASHQ